MVFRNSARAFGFSSALLLSVVLITPAHAATTYYVAPTGSDSNAGTQAAPFKTPQHAADVTNPGDTVYVRGGTYTNNTTSDTLDISRSGTASAYITYKAYPGEHPIFSFTKAWEGINILANYIVVDGFEVVGNAQNISYTTANPPSTGTPLGNEACINIGTSVGTGPYYHHIIVQNNTVHHCSETGIQTGHVDYVTIQNNIAHDNSWWSPYAGSGISVDESMDIDTNTGYKTFVLGNISYNNIEYVGDKAANWEITDGEGIIIDDNEDLQKPPNIAYKGRTLVANNITYGNGGPGIEVYTSQHVDVINNVAYQNQTNHSGIEGELAPASASDVTFFNNIAYAANGKAVNASGSGYTYGYNLYNTTPAVMGTNDKVGNPLFVNAAGGDFHLQSNSPAIDAGISTFNGRAATATDIAGATRPQGAGYDKGAYEAGSVQQGDTTAPSTPTNLSATASSQTQINLSWTASSDNVGVTGYKVFRNGTQVGTASGTTYSDTGLTAATTYSYTVSAYDAAGNTSVQSGAASATTQSTTPAETPYGGTAASIPGTIEVENYDLGGEGIAYHDLDATNNGGQYRTTEGVDIKTCTDTTGCGYAMGWIQQGEWTKYMVNVTTAGTYVFSARVAAINSGQTFHVEMDGINVTGSVTVPVQAAYTNWATVSVSNINLTAGPHVMRFVMDTNNYMDVNNFTWALQGATDTTAPSTPTNLSATASSQTQINLSWTASSDNVGVTGYKVFRNGTQVGTASGTTYSDTGLTAATTYSYTVSAYDAAGNTSVQSGAASATTQAATIKIGSRIKTTTSSKVRQSYSSSSRLLGTQQTGALGTVTQGPKSGSGYTWWYVNFDSGADGWVIVNNLTTKLAGVAPTQTFASTDLAPSAVQATDLTQPLVPGMVHPAVITLQRILNQDAATQVAAVGEGSPGNETDYFGHMTMNAVQKFQEKWGIVSAGSPSTSGFGAVGPKTLQKLREVLGL